MKYNLGLETIWLSIRYYASQLTRKRDFLIIIICHLACLQVFLLGCIHKVSG